MQRILIFSLEEEYKVMRAEEQAEFLGCRSNIDHVLSLQQIIEKKRAQSPNSIFLDTRKVSHNVSLWTVLKSFEINSDFLL